MADNLNSAELKIVARFVDEASAPLRALSGEVQRLGTGTATAAIQGITPQAQSASAALGGVAKQGVFAFAQIEQAAAPAEKAIEKVGQAASKIGGGQQAKSALSDLLLLGKTSADALGLVARNLDLIGLRGPANLAAVSSSAAATGTTIGQLTGSVSALGAVVTAVALGAGGILLLTKAIASAVRSSIEFEREFSRVIVLLDLTEKQTASLRAEVYSLARAYNIDARTAASAFYVAVEEGARNAAEANEIVDASAKIASLSLGDLGTSVAIISDVLSVYGDQAGTAEEVGNKIALTSTRAATSVTTLARGFGTLLPIGKQLGAGFEETLALLELLRDSGVKASKTFTALTQTFAALADPETRTFLRANGVSISDLRIQAEGIVPILLDINRAFADQPEKLAKIAPPLGGFDLLLGKLRVNADRLKPSLDALRTDKDFLSDASARRLAEAFNVVDRAGKNLDNRFDELFGNKTTEELAKIILLLERHENLLRALDLAARAASESIGFYARQISAVISISGAVADSLASVIKLFDRASSAKDELDKAPAGESKLAKFVRALGGEVIDQIIPFNKIAKAIEDYQSKASKLDGSGFKKEATEAQKLAEQIQSAENWQRLVIKRFEQSIPLTIETQGIDAAVEAVNEFAGKVASARERMKLEGRGAFDALQALAKASIGYVGQISEAPREFTDAVRAYEAEFRKFVGYTVDGAGKVVAQFEKLKPGRDFAPFILSPFEKTDVQKSIDDALRGFDAIPLDVELVFPDTVVEDAAKTLRQFRSSAAFFNIELIDADQRKRLEDALAIVSRFQSEVSKAKELSDDLREASLSGTEAEAFALDKRFSDLTRQVDALERLGFRVSGFRDLVNKAKNVGLDKIKKEIEEAAAKTAEEQARISQASDDAENRIRATFAGFDKQLLTGFAAERVALDQSIAAARAEFEKIANDPSQTGGTRAFARFAIEDLEELRGRLSDALGIREEQEKAQKLREELSKLFALRAETIGGAAGEFAALTEATYAQIEAEEARRDSANEDSELIQKQIDQLRKLGDAQAGSLVFDFTFRPTVEFDNDRIREEIIEQFRPQLDELREAAEKALSGDSIDTGALRKKIREVTNAMRAARIAAQQEADRFGVGFTDGVLASIEEFTDQARIGFNLARDTASLLSESISTLIQDLARGEASFKDFFRTILAGFTKLIADILAQQLTAAIFSNLFSTIGAAAAGGLPVFSGAVGGIGFARGGVMPGQMLGMNAMPSGANFGPPLPVRKYAMGGIANTPQHAIFAEKPGMAEAFVPLPGVGRGIPVEFKNPDAARGGTSITVNYTIHAVDGPSVERMLEIHGRKIGDIAAGQIASRSNRALVSSIRGVPR